jgi:hypothetical protein
MRSAGNFSSEWGYLAPAPSFLRTARIVIVATAIGATAGAGVVISLADHPTGETGKTSIAAHAIVTSVQAATPPAMPLAANAPADTPATAGMSTTPVQEQSQPQDAGMTPSQPTTTTTAVAAPSVAGPANSSSAAASPGVASLSENPAEAAEAPVPELTPPAKKLSKHHGKGAYAYYNTKQKPAPGLGLMLRRLFTARSSTSYYPDRGL